MTVSYNSFDAALASHPHQKMSKGIYTIDATEIRLPTGTLTEPDSNGKIMFVMSDGSSYGLWGGHVSADRYIADSNQNAGIWVRTYKPMLHPDFTYEGVRKAANTTTVKNSGHERKITATPVPAGVGVATFKKPRTDKWVGFANAPFSKESAYVYQYCIDNDIFSYVKRIAGLGDMAHYQRKRLHRGIDVTAPHHDRNTDSDRVIAWKDMTISQVRTLHGAAGNVVCVYDAQADLAFTFMHLRHAPKFKPGDKVAKGTVLGHMGKTGDSKRTPTGYHYHICVERGGYFKSSNQLAAEMSNGLMMYLFMRMGGGRNVWSGTNVDQHETLKAAFQV